MKTCTICREGKPLDQFYGYRGACKPCWRARQKVYRQADPERARGIDARYREAHRDRINARRRERLLEDPQLRERKLAGARRWHAANREAANERSRRYAVDNQERLRAYYASRLQAQRDRARARRQLDPVTSRLRGHEYRARRVQATSKRFTRKDLFADWARRGIPQDRCVWCTDGAFEHVDHVVALTRGGAHSMDNLVPSCRRCNQSKKDRTAAQWFTWIEDPESVYRARRWGLVDPRG